MLAGCAPKTTLNDATNYLLIQENLTTLSLYRTAIQENKTGLMTVTEVYDSHLKKPVSSFDELQSFLYQNDCTRYVKKDLILTCYKITRLKLIETMHVLDDTRYKVYLLNSSVGVLRSNMKDIIEGFPEIHH